MKNKNAFTLIELLIVMAILSALASIAIISFSGAQKTAKDTKRKSDLRQYQTAIEIFANKNNGVFPVRSSAVSAFSLCGASNPLGSINCVDDADNTKHYMYQSNAAGTSYVLYATYDRPLIPGMNYFVICSNGTVGDSSSTGSGGVCPI
jgi:prepilin-type N-terminal cleavage/methylation domain-containing protein